MKNNIDVPTTEQFISALFKATDEQKARAFNILTDADANSKPQDKLLTKKQASDFLGISPASLDRFVQNKKVTKIQFGGKHSKNLFKQSELQALIDSSKVTTQPSTPEAIA